MDMHSVLLIVNNLLLVNRPLREFEVLMYEKLCDVVAKHSECALFNMNKALDDAAKDNQKEKNEQLPPGGTEPETPPGGTEG